MLSKISVQFLEELEASLLLLHLDAAEAAKAECKFGMEVGCKTISLEELGQKRDLGQDMSGVKYYLGARFITEIKYK